MRAWALAQGALKKCVYAYGRCLFVYEVIRNALRAARLVNMVGNLIPLKYSVSSKYHLTMKAGWGNFPCL